MNVDKVLLTRRGNISVYFRNYKFRKILNFANGTVKFACTRKDCAAIVHTTCDFKKVVEIKHGHFLGGDPANIHEPYTDDQVQMDLLRVETKRKASEELSVRPAKIVRQVLRTKLEDNSIIDNEKLQLLRKTAYRSRRKNQPALPKTTEEARETLHRIQGTLQTLKGDQFCFSDPENDIFIFTTIENLTVLCDACEVFGDGTFDFAPKFFEQLYTLHVFKNGYCIQVTFCFLPNKKTATYDKMWALLKYLCRNLLNRELEIPMFVADFEKGAHNSVKNNFCACKVRCCRFHLGQSWYRWIQKDRFLRQHYSDPNSVIGNYLRSFFGLSLLPAVQVFDAFITMLLANPGIDNG